MKNFLYNTFVPNEREPVVLMICKMIILMVTAIVAFIAFFSSVILTNGLSFVIAIFLILAYVIYNGLVNHERNSND